VGGFGRKGGREIVVGDARIWCGERGDPAAPALLLLHGGFGSVESFDPIAERLASRFRLVGIDSRGHGASSMGSERLSYARLAADVEAVAAALGIGRCDLLGISDGAIVGLRLAAAGWSRLGRLATIGATWRLLPDDPVEALLRDLTPEGWRQIDPAAHAVYLRVSPAPDVPALIAAVRGLWLDGTAAGYPGETVRGIAAPVLFIRGDRDPFISRAESAELADRVAGARLLNLAFAGHDAHVDEPEAVAAALLRFLGTA
jgi:pimeloyl-ACP methyl ester carboxylesterase